MFLLLLTVWGLGLLGLDSQALSDFLLYTILSPPVDSFNGHPVNWSADFRQFCELALVGLKTHEIGSAATA